MGMDKSRARDKFYELGEQTGCFKWWYRIWRRSEVDLHESVKNCLKSKPADQMKLNRDYTATSTNVVDLLGWQGFVDNIPVIDGDFLPNDPKTLLLNSNYLRDNGVSERKYVSGMVNNEGGPLVEYFFNGPNKDALKTNENFKRLAKDYAEIYHRYGVNDKVQDFLEFLYTYPRDVNQNQPKVQSFADLNTDSWYVYPSVAFLSLMAQSSPSTDTYQYLFDHTPELVNRSLPIPA